MDIKTVLEGVPTKDLVEVIRNRAGVEAVDVAPYEEYAVVTDEYYTDDTGPALILVVTD